MVKINRQRGSGTMLSSSIIVVLLVATVFAVILAAWLGSARRLRNQADLVALDAARAHASGRAACKAAEASIEMNKEAGEELKLNSCEVEAGIGEFVVAIELETSPKPRILGGLKSVKAAAKAGVIDET